jgi:signal transduction histidine kinase
MSEEHNDKDLHLEFKSTLDDSFAIKSNEETVSQILQKIIDNALKFTEEGSVCVEVGRKGKTLEISVTDTGIGIPADKQETIFDNFVKLNDFKGGVGLGLSISRRLAKTLGGNIILDSTYTTGSRFIIQLPIIMAQKKAK